MVPLGIRICILSSVMTPSSSHNHPHDSTSAFILLNMRTANAPNPEVGPLRGLRRAHGDQSSGGYPVSTDVQCFIHFLGLRAAATIPPLWCTCPGTYRLSVPQLQSPAVVPLETSGELAWSLGSHSRDATETALLYTWPYGLGSRSKFKTFLLHLHGAEF